METQKVQRLKFLPACKVVSSKDEEPLEVCGNTHPRYMAASVQEIERRQNPAHGAELYVKPAVNNSGLCVCSA